MQQIKQDLNRSGWETTDMPSFCQPCLPNRTYLKILKEDYGAECKICTRPFTVFSLRNGRAIREKRTNVCLTCAKLKNCCQCCMQDLSFRIPLDVRDAALKMVAPGPKSDINRQFYAQEHEKEIEDGRGALEVHEKTEEKARQLLRRLAESETYSKKRRRLDAETEENGQKALPAPERSNRVSNGTSNGTSNGYSNGTSNGTSNGYSNGNSNGATNGTSNGYSNGAGANGHVPGPTRTRGTKATLGARGARGGRMNGTTPEPSPQDWLPPSDPKVVSLFVTGVEDDLPEHDLRTHFAQYGPLRSLVCSHRAHCAYVNYTKRADAEKAAEKLKGKVVIKGCPMRVTWGKPKQLDSLDQNVRMQYAKEGRQVAAPARQNNGATRAIESDPKSVLDQTVIAPPPGADDETSYNTLRGD